MKIVITDIRQLDKADEFVVDAIVDGARRSFTFGVMLPDARGAIGLSGDIGTISGYTFAGREIVARVIRTYKGESFDFPIDLGDV